MIAKLDAFKAQGVDFQSLTDSIDTKTPLIIEVQAGNWGNNWKMFQMAVVLETNVSNFFGCVKNNENTYENSAYSIWRALG